MSGNPTGSSNVVPMAKASAPAPASYPPQQPMPFPMWGGGGSLPWGPGCCPPGGMDALMKCYCDVQAATAFICSVMVQCIQTNPAVVQAIIAAIEASGSAVPLVGVTNGSDAQPGQVGEWIFFDQLGIPFTAAPQTQTFTMGVLQPGDWDIWLVCYSGSPLMGMSINLSPAPPQPGISGFTQAFFITDVSGGSQQTQISTPTFRGSFSTPYLIAISVTTNQNAPGPGAGTLSLAAIARRRR